MKRRLFALLPTLALLAAHTATQAQAPAPTFPNKAVTIIVGFAPGGGGDIAMRWMANFLQERWKVPVIVDNKPGAGATVATAQLARAKPDGYTVALATSSPMTVAPLFQKVAYDPAKDFSYLFQFHVTAQPLVVKADSPFKTMQELMAWAKANPGKLFWSTAATNGATHIATHAAFKAAGIDATYVPFKGGMEPINAVLGGQIQAVVSDGAMALAQAGQMRLLAESGNIKIPGYTNIPTYKELGFPVSVPIFYGVAGPAGIPDEVVREWNAAARDMMKTQGFADMVQKLRATPAYLDSAEFTTQIKGMYANMGKLVTQLDLKKD